MPDQALIDEMARLEARRRDEQIQDDLDDIYVRLIAIHEKVFDEEDDGFEPDDSIADLLG